MAGNNRRPISIAEQIFDQLEKEILSGVYEKGEIVSELKLSEGLGVSRTPVREAITRLVGEHLLKETGKGLEVVGISREDVLDMYEIRLRIEGLSSARAAKNITEEQLSQMGELIEMQEFHIEKQNQTGEDRSEKIKDLDSKFHELLYEASCSQALCDVLIPLHKKITKYRKASVRKASRAAKSVQEHYDIYKALKERDEEKASELTIKHIENARNSILGLEE